jgi:putative transposase
MDAVVVMPDHLHCVWRLPEEDSDFSSRWREIKKFVTRRIMPENAATQAQVFGSI